MDQFSQIRQDLTTPSLMSALRSDAEIRSKLNAHELATMDAILNEVGTPDEYPSIAQFVLRALPYAKMSYASPEVNEPIPPPERTIQLIMRQRFLVK